VEGAVVKSRLMASEGNLESMDFKGKKRRETGCGERIRKRLETPDS
jgi:hypothetical protein